MRGFFTMLLLAAAAALPPAQPGTILMARVVDVSSINGPLPLAPLEARGLPPGVPPLRGGFAPLPADSASKFLTLSAAFTTLFGLCVIVYPKCAFKYMLFLRETPPSSDLVGEMMGCAMVAWGCAKVSAIRQGNEASRAFCRLNTIPMTLLVGTMIKNSAGPLAVGAMSFFLAACGLLGFA